jgi:hypothetical protein
VKTRFPFVFLLGAVVGLWGLGWGLPSPARFRAFPMAMTPEVAAEFSDAWTKLYARIKQAHVELKGEPETYVHGVEEVAPGWTFPPPNLLNSFRALLLQSTNPDEKKTFIILAQMHPRKLELKPLYAQYGGAFVYSLGAFLELGSILRAVTVVSDMGHYLQHPEDMGRMYRWGRLYMILFSLATLWVIYDMGRRLGDEETGLWAAVFFCLSPIVVLNSHLIKPHPIGAFWCLAALRFTLLALEKGQRRDYLLAGVCFGIGAGASSPFAAFSWLPLLAWLERRRQKKAGLREFWSVVASGAIAGAMFFVTNPYLMIEPKDFLWDFTVYVPHGEARGGTVAGFLALMGRAWGSLGAALSSLVLAGLGLAAFRKERAPRVVACVTLAMFAALWLLFGRFYTFGLNASGIHYYVPLFAPACLLAALTLKRVPKPWRAVLLAVVLIDTGARGGAVLINMRAASGPRAAMNRAADWIEANVPAGSSVGLARYPEPSHTPPFRYDRYRLVIFAQPELVKPGAEPRYVVVDGEGRGAFGGWLESRYELLQAFEPAALGWARVEDFPFYANPAAYVFKLRSP